MEISLRRFADLTPAELYDVARLRQDVFIIEQDCPYPDLDGRDAEPTTVHVLGHRGEGPERALAGCARVLVDEAGTRAAAGPLWRIGRIALHPSARGQGLSAPLMEAALEVCDADPGDVVLDAQAPLEGFYAGFGFRPDGPGFLEDGIPHVPMRRRAG